MAKKQIFEDKIVLMNTIISIKVISDLGTIHTKELLSNALSKFEYVVQKYTRFNDDSQLSALNRRSGQAVTIDLEFFELIEEMLEMARKTNGKYDPTIIDLLEAYGYDQKGNYHVLEDPNIHKKIRDLAKNRPTFNEIELDKNNLTVKLAQGQRLDLGSIGKGFAIDLASEVLTELESFVINAGGDIRAQGKRIDGKLWKVGLVQMPKIDSTNQSKILGHVKLNNQSLASSGGWARKVKFFHHLLNPTTGLPENKTIQTYVLAKTARKADLWSTALFVMGSDGMSILEDEANIEAMLVNENEQLHKTTNFSYSV